MDKLINIINPVNKTDKWLCASAKSVLKQTYSKNEMILVDDEVNMILKSVDTQKNQLEGKCGGLFFRNMYIFALNIVAA